MTAIPEMNGAGSPASEPSVPESSRAALKRRLRRVIVGMTTIRETDGPADPGAIHQLRVATRRAGAAIRALGDDLSGRRAREVTRRLRRLRRSAGEVRGCDVLHDLLVRPSEPWSEDLAPAVSFAAQVLVERRTAAMDILVDGCRRRRRSKLREASRELVRGLARDKDRGAGRADDAGHDADHDGQDHIRRRVDAILTEFVTARPEGLATYEALHAHRLLGKRLRYSLEFFAQAFEGAPHAAVLARVIEAQDRLGQINDYHDLLGFLEALWQSNKAADPAREGLVALARLARERRDARRDAFLAWWGSRGAPALFEARAALLGRPDAGAEPVRPLGEAEHSGANGAAAKTPVHAVGGTPR